jgi:hypothetical protein
MLRPFMQGRPRPLRELGGGPGGGALEVSIDGFRPEVVALLQRSPHPASLIRPSQQGHRLGQAHRHLQNLRTESAHGEQDASHHLFAEDRGEAETVASHLDLQVLMGHMGWSSLLTRVWMSAGRRSNTSSGSEP